MTNDNTIKKTKRIGIIGAGPAGLTSAKQGLAQGFDVIVYEKQSHLGGIWNKFGKGAYQSVRMQSSKLSFHFSDYPPKNSISDFPTRNEVYDYLVSYADHFNISTNIRYNTAVIQVEKKAGCWHMTSESIDNKKHTTEIFDIVMVASGELWDPNLPKDFSITSTKKTPTKETSVEEILVEEKPVKEKPVKEKRTGYRTAKEYNTPEEFKGKRVLVVGGGVSGADIAAELSNHATVDWSIRTPRLFLPRIIGSAYNDELFSYIGRIASQEMLYEDFLAYLDKHIPDYMAIYRQSGLLPSHTINNAIHVNDRIVPAVASGAITMRPPFAKITDIGVQFAHSKEENTKKGDNKEDDKNSIQTYDDVIFCTGYALPDYSFIKEFDATDLYEHFIYRKDPTLAVINTPIRTEAFGTACPYFEMIAHYALETALGYLPLPNDESMKQWCDENLKTKKPRCYYDCWLETIRLGLMANVIPHPTDDFKSYWNIVSQSVSPSFLQLNSAPSKKPSVIDKGVSLSQLQLRLLKSFSISELANLLEKNHIEQDILDNLPSCLQSAINPQLLYEKPPL